MRPLVLIAICASLVLLASQAPQTRPVPVRAAVAELTPVMYLPLISASLFVVQDPDAQYQITLLRQLTPCENQGNHNVYVLVLDTQGNGIPNTSVEFSWATGAFTGVTGLKIENIPALGVNPQTTAGFVDWPTFSHASVRTRVLSGLSEQTPWLREDLPDQRCETNDNPQGNSLYHYSYLVNFRKRW